MLELSRDKIPVAMTSSDSFVIREPGSKKLALAFTGFARRTGVNLQECYAYFAPHRANVVFLGDDHRAFYLRGVKSMGQGLAQSLDYLRRLRTEWQITDLVTFGCSAGGYGAVLFGAHLQARRMLTIAGITNVTAGFDPRTESYSRTEVLSEIAKERTLNLRDVLSSIADPPCLDAYYATDCAEDVTQAKNLAGLGNVVLHSAETGRHAVILEMHRAGVLSQAFDRLYDH